ncbi:MAG: MFS transporter [Candidatus Eisenbacteria bacterium]
MARPTAPTTTVPPAATAASARLRSFLAFCAYDVGDSAFATTILAVLYNQYFARTVAGGETGIAILGARIPGATLYSWLVSLSMLAVAVAGPFLGARADLGGRRLPWLRGFSIAGIAATIALVSVGPGQWVRGSLLFMLAYAAFAAASIFYNAILPTLGEPERLGRLSGIAWGFGYLGGAAVLLLNLAVVAAPARYGLSGTNEALRVSFAMAGVWWLLFALPLLVSREPAIPGRAGKAGGTGTASAGAREAIRRVRRTLGEIRRTRHIFRYLLAYLIYNDGIQTVIGTASIFAAAELGFTTQQLIYLFLMIQGTAFVGALAAGRIADAAGHRTTILAQLVGWVVLTAWGRWVGIFGAARTEFWILSAVAGVLLAGVQTVSRSLLARWTPVERSAEIFGFFSVAGRFASVLGPLVFGAVAWMSGGLRPATLSVGLFFVLGIVLLLRVDERQGERELRETAAPAASAARAAPDAPAASAAPAAPGAPGAPAEGP